MKRLTQILSEYEIIVVGGLVLASVALPSFLSVSCVVALLFWIIRWIAFGSPSIPTPADWSILVLFLLGLGSIWVSALPEITSTQVLRLISGIAIYYAIVNWMNNCLSVKGWKPEKRLQILTILTVGCGILLAFLAIFTLRQQTLKLFFLPSILYNMLPTWGEGGIHPNVMAGTLVLLWPLAISGFAFISGKRHPRQRIFYSIATAIIGSMILFTQSRGALLAVGFVLLGLICLRWHYGWVFLAMLVFLSIFLVQLIDMNYIVSLLSAGVSVSGSEGRIEVWSRGINLIRDFPFTGIGMGTFENVSGILYPFSVTTNEAIPHTHNLFLQIAVDLGLLGLLAWLWILISSIISAWKVYSLGLRKGRTQIIAIGAGLILSQIALITHGFLDAVTWGMVRPAPFVWIIWGLSMAAEYIYRMPQPNYS